MIGLSRCQLSKRADTPTSNFIERREYRILETAGSATNFRFRLARRLRPPLRIGAPRAFPVPADLAGTPEARAVRALVDEEPAATLCLATAKPRRVVRGEQRG